MTARGAAASDTARLEDWPLRPWLLAGIGALAGLVIHLILESDGESRVGASLAATVFFAAAAGSFVLSPSRWKEAALFALGLGVVMGGIAWLAVDTGDRVAGEEFAFAAGVFFSLLAIPLFQADFHRRRWATPYAETHFHVWSDAVSAGGALAFTLLSWLLLWLLHALFSLIGIEVIEQLIETDGFAGMFCGATFGAAMGVLRNQLAIIGTLQRVVMLVFALLAVPFGVAILIFVAILLFSGGSALWDATDSATPVLLSCALGCFVLANAVVRDDDAARSDNVVMQAAALVLSASIFPLTVFAAISMGIRIDQHGLSPERLWALVAIVLATAYGFAYGVGLARGRMANWSHNLRRANLHLAAVTCVIALLLALPLVNFGGISARQQVARLDAGKVSAEDFDFTALRWDFGDAGREVLDRLAERDGSIGLLATAAVEQTMRPGYGSRQNEEREFNFRIQPADPSIEPLVEELLRNQAYICQNYCVVLQLGENPDGTMRVAVINRRDFRIENIGIPTSSGSPQEPRQEPPELAEDSVVEIRSVPTDYIFIDGAPLGRPISDQPPPIDIVQPIEMSASE